MWLGGDRRREKSVKGKQRVSFNDKTIFLYKTSREMLPMTGVNHPRVFLKADDPDLISNV